MLISMRIENASFIIILHVVTDKINECLRYHETKRNERTDHGHNTGLRAPYSLLGPDKLRLNVLEKYFVGTFLSCLIKDPR